MPLNRRRSAMINIRLTPEEVRAAAQVAAGRNTTVTGLLRELLRAAVNR